MDYNELFEQAVKELTAAGADVAVSNIPAAVGIKRARFSFLGYLGKVKMDARNEVEPFVSVGLTGCQKFKIFPGHGEVLKALRASVKSLLDTQKRQYKALHTQLHSKDLEVARTTEATQALDALIKAQGESNGAGKAVP